jgi:uncharacterized LabA/DUF88 family protein
MADRVCVFIDGANFYHQCRENLGRTDVDIAAFVGWLVSNRTLVRTYFYTVRLTPDHAEEERKKQQKFLGALDHVPYLEVRMGKLVKRDTVCEDCGTRHEKYVEKGVDMRVGIDMLSAAAKKMYDTAILVSGDGDLAEAVRAVKELGLHVEVAAFVKGKAYELTQMADLNRELTPADLQPFLIRKTTSVP